VLDSDRDGKLMWEGLHPIIFPEKQEFKLAIKRKRKKSINGSGGGGGGDGSFSFTKGENNTRQDSYKSVKSIHDETSTDGGQGQGGRDTMMNGEESKDIGEEWEYSLPTDSSIRPLSHRKRNSIVHSIRDSIVGMISVGSGKTESSSHEQQNSKSSVSDSMSHSDSNSVQASSASAVSLGDVMKQEDANDTNGKTGIEMSNTNSKSHHAQAPSTVVQRPSLVGKLFAPIPEEQERQQAEYDDENEIEADVTSKSNKKSTKIRFADDVKLERRSDEEDDGEDEEDGEDDMDEFDSQESISEERGSDWRDEDDLLESVPDHYDEDDEDNKKKEKGSNADSSPNTTLNFSQQHLYSPLSTNEEESKQGQVMIRDAALEDEDDRNAVIQAPRQVSYFTRNANDFVDV
jgi:hypothetical protein